MNDTNHTTDNASDDAVIIVPGKCFDRIIRLLENPPEANDALKRLLLDKVPADPDGVDTFKDDLSPGTGEEESARAK